MHMIRLPFITRSSSAQMIGLKYKEITTQAKLNDSKSISKSATSKNEPHVRVMTKLLNGWDVNSS